MDTIVHLFSLVCGQAPAHTWSPGGLWLPCCQRCTGLYVGALIAALLHLVFRPRLNRRFLEIHGAFLLLMVPFGYHWLPQGPGLRALTGVLFGFGVVTFLLLPLVEAEASSRWRKREPEDTPRSIRRYFSGVLATACLVPLLGARGATIAGLSLTLLACGGALALFLLVLLNARLGLGAALRAVWSLCQPRAGA